MYKNFSLLFFLLPLFCFSQVGINNIDPKATLDITASNTSNPDPTDGILIPRVDAFSTTNPIADQDSMIVYLTTTDGTNTPGFYYWNNASTSWLPFGSSKDAWELQGNAGTDDAVNFIGTTDNEEFVFKTNNTEFARLTTKGQFELSDANLNTFIGKQAGENITTGRRNILIGSNAGLSSVFNRDIIAIGDNASSLNTLGNNFIAIGSGALENSTDSDFSLAIGSGALNNRTTSRFNVGVGHRTLSFATTGNLNTALGGDAGRTTSGDNGIYIGYRSDSENDGGDNIVIGTRAGMQDTSSNPTGRILIGNNAWESQPGNNIFAIENSASITPLLYGEFDNNILRVGGTLQVGSSDDTTAGSFYAFPTADGTNGQVLTTNGAGAVTWQNGGAAPADSDWFEQGTTTAPDDINDNMFTQGNVGIGNTAPTTNLHITGITSLVGSTSVSTLLSQNFNGLATGEVPNVPGTFPYENNSSTNCNSADGWRISASDAATETTPSCTTCSGNRAIIDFGQAVCQQDNTLVVGSFIPTQTQIDVSFNYGYDAFRNTDVFSVTLNNITSPTNSVVLINNTTNANLYNQSPSFTPTVIVGNTYQFEVRYRADFSYGLTVDDILVTETLTATTDEYVFRLEDGQQQDGFVLTSDANGNGTWKASAGGSGTGTDDQDLTLVGNTLSIEDGNSVTLSDDWKTTGNAGTNPATNFLGTTDDQDLVFKTNNLERLRITTNGRYETSNSGNNIYFGTGAGANDNFAFGHNNVAIGVDALSANVVRSNNVAIGRRAMESSTGLDTSVAIGNNALSDAITGANSVAVGRNSLLNNLDSDRNTAIGSNALGGSTTGKSNTALGYKAGTFAEEDGNVFIGSLADEQNVGGQNVVIGTQAGKVDAFGLNLDGRVFLGFNAGQNNPNENVLAIENSNSVSPLIGGDFANDRVGINVDISNTANLTHTLTVNGNIRASGGFSTPTNNYPDYVFEDYFTGNSKLNSSYKFTTLENAIAFVKENGHLPNVKSYQEVKDNGMAIDLGETSVKNLEKIEENFIYISELKSEMDTLKEENKLLKEKLELILKKLEDK